MPIVGGDWVEDLTNAQTTREVAARELGYSLTAVSGLSVDLQINMGGVWQSLGAPLTVAGEFGVVSDGNFRDRRYRAVSTGTGTATIVLSPDNPLIG